MRTFLESWEQQTSSSSSSSNSDSDNDRDSLYVVPLAVRDEKEMVSLDLNKLDLKMDIDDDNNDKSLSLMRDLKTTMTYDSKDCFGEETALKKLKTESSLEQLQDGDLNYTSATKKSGSLFGVFHGKSDEKSEMDYSYYISNDAAIKKNITTEKVDIWEKLTELKTGNTVLSRSSLNLPPVSSSTGKIEKRCFATRTVSPVQEDTSKPLSQCLVKNWAEDEYTPLEHFAPYIAFDEDLGMTMKRKRR